MVTLTSADHKDTLTMKSSTIREEEFKWVWEVTPGN